jgi:hypothetical protein
MRRSGLWTLGALTGLLLVLAQLPAGGAAPGCATQIGMQDASRHTKPSSFEPHARPPGNAYGTPIGDKILSKPLRKKKPAGATAKTPVPA